MCYEEKKYCTEYYFYADYLWNLWLILVVCLTDETNQAAGEQKTTGVMALIFTLITCGIYGLYWAYCCGEKIDKAKANRGTPASNGGVLYLILYIFGGVIAYALIQHELNKLIEQDEA